jgi:uncharacterized protein
VSFERRALIRMNRRTFIKRTALAAPFAAVGGALYGRYIERHDIEVASIDVELGLGEPLTAAVIGDIHFDPLFEIDYLEAMVAAVNGTNPDVLLYAGDFVTDSTSRLPDSLAVLSKAQATYGAVAILGNHDHWCIGRPG